MSDSQPRSRAAVAGWIAAAVFFVGGAVAVVYASNLRNQLNDVELRLIDAVTKMQMLQDQLVAAAGQSDAMKGSLSILSASDVVDARLTGRGSAPDASARVFVSATKGLLLSASKLPPTLPGRTYQLWWQGAKGPMTVGVFGTAQDGSATAAFDLPTDLPTGTVFSITDESEGGAESPSSTVVAASR